MKNVGDFYLKIFSFLEVNFSIYLNRRVFLMEIFFSAPKFSHAHFQYVCGVCVKF